VARRHLTTHRFDEALTLFIQFEVQSFQFHSYCGFRPEPSIVPSWVKASFWVKPGQQGETGFLTRPSPGLSVLRGSGGALLRPLWSAPAKRSDDGAFERAKEPLHSKPLRACESPESVRGSALPPHSIGEHRSAVFLTSASLSLHQQFRWRWPVRRHIPIQTHFGQLLANEAQVPKMNGVFPFAHRQLRAVGVKRDPGDLPRIGWLEVCQRLAR
jgi:hypothetical protein